MSLFKDLIDSIKWLFNRNQETDREVTGSPPQTDQSTEPTTVTDAIPELPVTIDGLEAFTDKHPEIVYKFVLKRLKKAVWNREPSTMLFKLKDFQVKLNRSKYIQQLEIIQNYYTNVEDYEQAAVCRDLIQHLRIQSIME